MTLLDASAPVRPDGPVARDPVPRVAAVTHADAVATAAGRIAPLWPLDRFVAVNPYVGLADLSFADAAGRLAAVAGARTTRPADHYRRAWSEGRLEVADVAGAAAAVSPNPIGSVEELLVAAEARPPVGSPLVATVADVAAELTGRDWPRLQIDRISAWAAAYVDEGQALWRNPDQTAPVFQAWAREAAVDRTPEILGLRGFRATVRSLPRDARAATDLALDRLGVPAEAVELYVHALLLRVGGWAGHLARLGFERSLRGEPDDGVVQLAAVLLAWELGVHEAVGRRHAALDERWREAVARTVAVAHDLQQGPAPAELAVLQTAVERAEQRRLAGSIASVAAAAASPSGVAPAVRPSAQAVFCIDVRSEVFRRHLEAADPTVETLGFAGFFGMAVELVPVAHDHGADQCPVLLTPAWTVAETTGGPDDLLAAAEHRRLAHHVRRAWKSFKMGAISCFSFVGPVGLAYLPKLFRDDLGVGRPVPAPASEGLAPASDAARHPSLEALVAPGGPDVTGIPAAARIDLAEGALRGMSLTEGFAPLVLLVGHGATTVNNPYDSGLACGACGGHTGEANARVAAAILNNGEVRRGLVARGITIPADTWFVAGLHDTTTDAVVLADADRVPVEHRPALADVAAALDRAGHAARVERAPRLGIGPDEDVDAAIVRRSTDWAQVRPEWGLAGCRAFVAAPRHRTRGADLGGQVFLHSYDWRADAGFSVLELILTAPVVVASWINLQYYGSTVDNERWGSGNKVLHNVVGRLGVLEGNGGDLRVGLPWQSVHDGTDHQHEPLRLTVVVEAPTAAISEVLAAHPEVRDLVDHGWIHLLAMDDDGRIAHRYAGDLAWTPFEA